MPTKFRNIIYFVFYLSCQAQYGQEDISTSPDFLKNSSYENIFESYQEVFEDTIKSKIYLGAYLKKATKENNLLRKSQALTYLSYYEKTESRKIALLDSAIILLPADTTSLKYFILPYSFKGAYFRNKGSYQLALNNYLKALEYAEKANSVPYEYITKHNIGILKVSIGKYEEAIALFKECLIQDKKVDDTESYGHNQTLLSISEAYLKNKQIDSASIHIEHGLKKTKDVYSDLYNQFVIFKGIDFFFKGENESAQKNIEKAIFHLNKRNPQLRRTLVLGYFYLGKINTLSNNSKKAEHSFLELDSLISDSKVLFPEVREGYEYLVSYYKKIDSKTDQLRFLNKLLAFDSIQYKDKNILSARLLNEFDTPILLKEKEILIGELLDEKRNLNSFLQISVFLTFMVSIGLFYQYKKRRSYKSKFLELMKEQKNPSSKIATNKTQEVFVKESNELDISPQIITKILDGLESFEMEKKFLNKDITSIKLAHILKTNTKYLSQIINHHKKKSFSNYLKDLRIDYSIEQLKKDSRLRRYTIQGISQEMGFNSTESFSSAFRKRTGIKPSYFIKEFNNLQASIEKSKFMNLDT